MHAVTKLRHIVHVVFCTLLLAGYSSMFVASALHDASHASEQEGTTAASIADVDQSEHIDLGCFFCAHVPVLSAQVDSQTLHVVQPVKFLAVYHTADRIIPDRTFLPGLRGPPSAGV